jgi:hypothetical protein
MNLFSRVVEWVTMKIPVENYFIALHVDFAALKSEYYLCKLSLIRENDVRICSRRCSLS